MHQHSPWRRNPESHHIPQKTQCIRSWNSTYTEVTSTHLEDELFQIQQPDLSTNIRKSHGIRCTPNYTIIFMAVLEEEILEQATKKIRLWIRFINDIFMIWNHTLVELDQFIEDLIIFHPTINFTKEVNEVGLLFLDTFVYKEDRKLKTRVYCKPTDNKQYLLYTSCHPRQHRDSTPFSLLIWARRICSKETEFEIEARSIANTPPGRENTQKIFFTKQLNMQEASTEKTSSSPKKRKKIQEYVTSSHNPRNPKMKDIMQQHIHLLVKMRRNPIILEQV